MSINSITLDQAEKNLETLSLLKNPENKYLKLCFSPDGKDVAIESGGSVTRTAKAIGNKVASYFAIDKVASYFAIDTGGWSRELNSLNPLIENTVTALNVDLTPLEIFLLAEKTQKAIEGLVALVNNQYREATDKAATINAAIKSLEGAYNKFKINYGVKDLLASTQLIESARKKFEHLEKGLLTQVEFLKILLDEKDDEIARLKQLLESKEPISSIDSKTDEQGQELVLPSVFATLASTLSDLKTDLNKDIEKLKNL